MQVHINIMIYNIYTESAIVKEKAKGLKTIGIFGSKYQNWFAGDGEKWGNGQAVA